MPMPFEFYYLTIVQPVVVALALVGWWRKRRETVESEESGPLALLMPPYPSDESERPGVVN
jgi:hypothetical protein